MGRRRKGNALTVLLHGHEWNPLPFNRLSTRKHHQISFIHYAGTPFFTNLLVPL